jgi:putative hydrolase
MDAVGPQVVPSVATIRSAFTRRRRKGRGPIDRLLRSLLGMDMKMSQYIKGEAFVSHVVSRAGMAQFNTIWSAPEALPSRAEIGDPAAWMARVL